MHFAVQHSYLFNRQRCASSQLSWFCWFVASAISFLQLQIWLHPCVNLFPRSNQSSKIGFAYNLSYQSISYSCQFWNRNIKISNNKIKHPLKSFFLNTNEIRCQNCFPTDRLNYLKAPRVWHLASPINYSPTHISQMSCFYWLQYPALANTIKI